ncbi:asparagine synthase (glutamine-hydrolyzing) [Patescibacteria group bacterium]|nr:asparagine synthase (glutamine-hydrolyzing) [Patescibacteria group bacterium]
MCGIAGIVAPQAAELQPHVHKMVGGLLHRGPDERGVYSFTNCSLGHTRLAVVDLGSGQQPMLAGHRKHGIVFNGEIYGYLKLKNQLPNYSFTTSSDTELILALYAQHGQQLLTHLPGMFAFALWDEQKQELFCARDRFGEKPFYYAIGKNGEFVFASEIKAIIASGLITPKLNHTAIAHYLQHLYIGPYETVYTNIFTLPPAHSLVLRGGEVTINRYWNFPLINEQISLSEATSTFQSLFKSAVSSQLVADVPVGAFLSGGLDSSTVVAAARDSVATLKTFSFSFEDSINELPYAREIAKKYHTDHTELSDNQYDIADLIVKMGSVFDEPFADSSNIPTYLISKLAKEHVTVVLTGDGGDELLGGYTGWYQPLLSAQSNTPPLSSALTMLGRQLFRVANKLRLPYRSELGNRLAGEQIKQQQHPSLLAAHSAQTSYFSDVELSTLLLEPYTTVPYRPHWQTNNSLDDVLRMDVDTYMPGDILTKIDRAAMAHGLELRAPFLDRDLAEFCLSIPYRLKVSASEDKIVLRRAFEDAWTDSIRKRKKQGFGAPVDKWLTLPKVQELKSHYLHDKNRALYKLVSYEACKPYLTANTYQTWVLLTLSIWLEEQKISL